MTMKTIIKPISTFLAIAFAFYPITTSGQSDTLTHPNYTISIGYQHYKPVSTFYNKALRLPKTKLSVALYSPKENFKTELSFGYFNVSSKDLIDPSYYNIDERNIIKSFCIGGSMTKQFYNKSFIFEAGIAGDIGYSREKYTAKTFHTYSTSWINQKDTYTDIRMALIGNIEYRMGYNISVFASGGLGANLTHLSNQYTHYYNEELNYSFYNLFGLRYNFK